MHAGNHSFKTFFSVSCKIKHFSRSQTSSRSGVLELNNIAVITVDSIISPTDISQQLSDLEHQLAQQSCWAICDMNELSDCRWELWLWIQGALLL